MEREVKFRTTKGGVRVYSWGYGFLNDKRWALFGKIIYLKEIFTYGFVPSRWVYSLPREVLEKTTNKIKQLEKKHENSK